MRIYNLTPNKMEERENRFKRVAERRTIEILDRLRVLGNCSNKVNYEYSEKEVEKIFSAIERQLKKTKALFRKSDSSDFSL
jgi:hypothetical protein